MYGLNNIQHIKIRKYMYDVCTVSFLKIVPEFPCVLGDRQIALIVSVYTEPFT